MRFGGDAVDKLMPKFEVTVAYVYGVKVLVEADNKYEAIKGALYGSGREIGVERIKVADDAGTPKEELGLDLQSEPEWFDSYLDDGYVTAILEVEDAKE